MSDPTDSKYLNETADAIIEEHAKKVAMQTLRKVTSDEQVLVQCIAFWDAVVKHPITGELHRQHARTLRWMMDHVTDHALLQCAETLEPFKPLNSARQCCARVAQVILKARGKGRTSILVN